MSSNADTKPTLVTVLERINDLRNEMNKRFDEQDKNIADFDVRVDRIEGVVSITRGEMVNLRADFRE